MTFPFFEFEFEPLTVLLKVFMEIGHRIRIQHRILHHIDWFYFDDPHA